MHFLEIELEYSCSTSLMLPPIHWTLLQTALNVRNILLHKTASVDMTSASSAVIFFSKLNYILYRCFDPLNISIDNMTDPINISIDNKTKQCLGWPKRCFG